MHDRPSVIILKCLNCGAGLEIDDDLARFACGYCGTEQLIQRRGGTVSLRPVTDAIAKVQRGTDKTAAELALRRLREELEPLKQRRSRRLKRAAEERGQVQNNFIRILAFSFLLLLGLAVKGGAAVLLLMVLPLIIGVSYRGKKHQAIDAALQRDLCLIESQVEELQVKIQRNTEVVDS